MALPPPKKKGGMDVAIMVGPHKPSPGSGSGGLGSPLPIEKSMMGGGKPDAGEPDSATAAPTSEHEAAETPEYEASEESGAKLLSDLADVGKRYGADPETSKALAADFFDAIAKCLRGGGGSGEAESPAEDQGEGGEQSESSNYR